MVGELDAADSDDLPGAPLLGRAQRPGPVGDEAADAGLAAGGEQVVDPSAEHGLARARTRRAELRVVGVRHDGEGAVPLLGKRLERVGAHAGGRQPGCPIGSRIDLSSQKADSPSGPSSRPIPEHL